MAITKTIQATVKNRTDTAANWTQKNPVLAEGEIIVVQTSAGETRLKIGDGVKTFTQLPYTDEQIYNNVVTSVNGQTGDVTLDIPGGGSDTVYVDFWPTGSEQYNGNFNGYQVELATDQTFDAIFDSIKAGNKIIARLYKDAEKSELAASSVDTAVAGTKEFGAIHFQFVTANADTGAIAGFPFIGETIMMIKWEEAAASYLIENRNVLPTPNADGTDNGKVPIINGTTWELKTPSGGGATNAVLYAPQTLTDAQKKQARQNIDVESYFVINGTLDDNLKPTLDKTFSQIREAISDGKIPIVAISDTYFQLSQNTDELITFLWSAADKNSSGFQTIDVYPTKAPQIHFYRLLSTDIFGALPQVNMAADPSSDMEIATKKYVDDKISDKELILSSSTAGSTKKFKLTIDDTGTLTASEITA